ncbi:hypothetical protein OBBRIDRAFT_49110 [Obba rivulosa]|uniref:Uncharacterized protein n=1 Tax=Obba rivulosa TaxID=1052685 RepID=A0A8E2DS67_9APHY|nr:hypothetical protein OBBRIDRAFT_49110 [Obba rivulosa]
MAKYMALPFGPAINDVRGVSSGRHSTSTDASGTAGDLLSLPTTRSATAKTIVVVSSSSHNNDVQPPKIIYMTASGSRRCTSQHYGATTMPLTAAGKGPTLHHAPRGSHHGTCRTPLLDSCTITIGGSWHCKITRCFSTGDPRFAAGCAACSLSVSAS